jgi:hypothetical protein
VVTLRRIVMLAALLGCLGAHAAEEEEIDVAPAIAAAEQWLALIDQGRYGASWEEASPMFQEAMSRHRWETTLPGARDPLGMPISRKMRQAHYTKALPNAPPGEYVVIQFDTRFEQRPLGTEIVTPMKVGDRWRVSGYIIR